MKLSGFVFIVCLYIYVPCFSSELPEFVQKYCNKIPHVRQNEGHVLDDNEKACIIAKYFCLFIPQKPDLIVDGVDRLRNKLLQTITQEQNISLILLGFPFKSTNHEKKCLSAHVDLGEYLSLVTLNTMMHNIRSIYPKVQCVLISDGLAYHVEDYDPDYNEILNYHMTMEKLV